MSRVIHFDHALGRTAIPFSSIATAIVIAIFPLFTLGARKRQSAWMVQGIDTKNGVWLWYWYRPGSGHDYRGSQLAHPSWLELVR